MCDTEELLADPVAIAELAESERALANGDVITGEELHIWMVNRRQ